MGMEMEMEMEDGAEGERKTMIERGIKENAQKKEERRRKRREKRERERGGRGRGIWMEKGKRRRVRKQEREREREKEKRVNRCFKSVSVQLRLEGRERALDNLLGSFMNLVVWVSFLYNCYYYLSATFLLVLLIRLFQSNVIPFDFQETKTRWMYDVVGRVHPRLSNEHLDRYQNVYSVSTPIS